MSILSEHVRAIRESLKKKPSHTQTTLSLMNSLSAEELVQTHEWMLAQRLPPTSFACFNEFFKAKDKQPALIYFLVHTPLLETKLHKTLLSYLSDTDLLNVMEQMLLQITEHKERTANFNEVLLCFCSRLYADQTPTALINQWPQKTYAKELIHYLMSNPDCVANLSQVNSTLYSLASWSSYYSALKCRIDALLNGIELNPTPARHYALIWLARFTEEPEGLHTLFTTLNSSKENRTSAGEHNLLVLKQAIWSILRPQAPFKEEEFLALFKTPKVEFAHAIHEVLAKEYAQYNPYQQALWLTKLGDESIKSTAEEWIAILKHSLQGTSLTNWKKAGAWLEKQSVKNQFIFIQRLMSSSTHPLFNQQAHQLITQCSQFKVHNDEFKEQELSWLGRYSKEEELPSWLEQVQKVYAKNKLNLGVLFSLMPANEKLLSTILTNEVFNTPEVVAKIFAELHLKTEASTHFSCVFQQISGKNKSWIKQFLAQVLPEINKVGEQLISLTVINNLILSKEDHFSVQEMEETQIIIDYLNLLVRLTKMTPKEEHLEALKQITFHLLHAFIMRSEAWGKVLFNTPAVRFIMLHYLPKVPYDSSFTIAGHPLTDLLLSPAVHQLDESIKKEDLMQQFIQELLIKAPERLEQEQFASLFAWLVPANKTAVSRAILSLAEHKDVQKKNIHLIIPFVTAKEAFSLFTNTKNTNLLKGIITHPNALQELTEVQWHDLFSALSAGEFIDILANEHIPISGRLNSLKAFYKAYKHNERLLAERLKEWNITEEQLLVLANFTVEDHRLFAKTLAAAGRRLELTNKLVPTLSLNPNSYLYKQIKEALQDNSLLMNAKLLQQFPLEELTNALQKQLIEAERLQALFSLFAPFATDKKQVPPLLHSAQWQHQLPLVHAGLLEVLAYYLRNKESAPTIASTIEKTSLFKVLQPFLTADAHKPTELTALYISLQEYCQLLAPLDKEHVHRIERMLARFDKDSAAIQHYSLPKLHDYFKSESMSAAVLSDSDTLFLTTAASAHKEWIAKKNNDPKKTFASTLISLLQETKWIGHKELTHWILGDALLSPLSQEVDNKIIEDYLNHLSLAQLSTHLDAMSEQLKSYQAAGHIIAQLTSSQSTLEWSNTLLSYDMDHLQQLISACEKLHLLFLKDFICLLSAIKKLDLSEVQRAHLLLDVAISQQKDTSWLLLDIKTASECVAHATQRFSQLNLLSYCYNANAQNNEERLSFLTEKAKHIPNDVLAHCINSFVPLFTNKEPQSQVFFTACELCLSKQQSTAIVEQLDEKTVSFLINRALAQPERYTSLIEKLINSNHQKLCQKLIQVKLKELLSLEESTAFSDITQLKSKQIEHYTPEQLGPILTLQRLLYFAKPLDELVPFINEKEPQSQLKKRLFCANASLYQALLNLQKSTGQPLERWFSRLRTQEQNNFKLYLAHMEEWQKGDEQAPVLLFHWIRWKTSFFSAVYNEPLLLPKELVHWLSKQKKEELDSAIYLQQLLEHAAEQKELCAVFNYTIEHQTLLSPEQKTWLCGTSLPFTLQEPEAVAFIVRLNSWDSLTQLLNKNKCSNLDIIKAALKKQRYCDEINSSEEKQTQFIKYIESANFSIQQLQELILTTTNKPIKSLLILHLLSQAVYLTSLQGHSFLDKLAEKNTHQPSRLNAFVHQLHPSILSKNRINGLSAETALSILCSIPHFHQLSAEQVQQLMTKLPPTTIEYWLNHYATMPNAYYLLAHLMKAADATVYTEFNKLSDDKKEWLRYCIIEHLEWFDVSHKILLECDKEALLVHALKLYLNGHRHQNYIQFIKQLTERLLSTNHIFSSQAIPFLIRLHDDPQFTELNNNTAYLINHNIKTHAQSSSFDLFYEAGNPIPSMTQLIQVKPKYPEIDKGKGLFAHLFKPILPSEESQVVLPYRAHPLIDVLVEKNINHIKAFDFFLIHYKENSEQLHKALHDYLSYYAQEPCTDTQRAAVSHTATFITRKEMDFSVREAIYKVFLSYPNLYDKHISYCMFLFDAKKTIQHFGLKGTKEAYHQVINLCTQALGKLDPKHNEEIIESANQALFEARTELAFAENDGFFARLFRRFQRCWAYGWTGFFKPKSPTYVAPLTANPTSELSTVGQKPQQQSSAQLRKELPTLLEELGRELSLAKLNELIKELEFWELKKNKELDIRYQLHQLFHTVLLESKKDTQLARWLERHQTKFITNRFYLLEHLLAQNKQEELFALLKEINEDSSHFHYLTQELVYATPTSIAANSSQPVKADAKSGLLDTAASIVQTALSWTTVFNFFGPGATAKTNTPPPPQAKETTAPPL